MKKLLVKSLIAAAILGSTAGVRAEEVTLKVHHFLNPQAPQQQLLMQPWCDKLAKDSNNKLKCQIYPSMQLGGTPAQLYDQARNGDVDVIFVLPGYTPNRFPRMEVCHSAKSPKYSDINCWITIDKSLVIVLPVWLVRQVQTYPLNVCILVLRMTATQSKGVL